MPNDTPSHESRPGSETSHSLLALLKQDDRRGWDRLIELYSPLVYHWCRKQGLPDQEIADVFQEVFRAVALHIKDYHHDRPGDTFRGWLRVVTRNKVRDFQRRRARQPQAAGGTEAHARIANLADEANGEEPGSDCRATDEQDPLEALLHRALERTRERVEQRTWQAFWMVVVDGQTPAEAAAQLSMRPGAVRVAKSRVLHRLRQELGDLLE